MAIIIIYIAFQAAALCTDRDIFIIAADMLFAKAGWQAPAEDISIINKGGCTAFRPFFLIS
jgi:hypothetical protein